MKIEKLTDSKIRIIIKKEDFESNNIDMHKFVLKSIESHNLFLKILNKAKKELDFDVDGYKLLIETFSSSDDIFIFTITKYIDSDFEDLSINKNKRSLRVKKKTHSINTLLKILNFNTFEDFCQFCEMFSHTNFDIKEICKNNSLYFYNNTYYLVLENINIYSPKFKMLNNHISEFTICKSFSKNFELKLKEHGKLIIRKNAITTTINTFVK